MTDLQQCPRCQADLSVGAPEGLCPSCLLQEGIKGPGSGPEEDVRSPAPGFVPPALGELNRYFPQLEILGIVGQGGMGAVYKARQTKLDRLLAVKVLPPKIASDPLFAERFMREARSLARLNHPNIVTIYDFGEADGLFYFTMEFVDGRNLRELLQAEELTPEQALQIIPQVCEALQYAHDEGVVHRDIKPENILLDKKGRVKIADFGLAKLVGLTPEYLTLTGTHEVMGTLLYMAPEQMRRSHTVDHRADIYSVGVVFYEMLTGELPLGRFAPPSHKAAIEEGVDPIVLRALAREPENRYQWASEMKKDLEALAAGQPRAIGMSEQAAGRAAPIVPFMIPDVHWSGAVARGLLRREGDHLVLECEVVGVLGRRSGFTEVKIPLRDIGSLTWAGGWGSSQVVLTVSRLSVLRKVPGSLQGRVRLLIAREDREVAKQFVAALGRMPPKSVGSRTNGEADENACSPSDDGRIRYRLTGPAVGLFIAALLNLASWAAIGGFSMVEQAKFGNAAAMLFAEIIIGIPIVALVGFVVFGAVKMVRLQSYPLALGAAIVILVPWSPASLLTILFGIWALVELRRPEVMAAFPGPDHLPEPALPPPPALPAEEPEPPERAPRRIPGVRRVMSLFNSMRNLFFATVVHRSLPGSTIDHSAAPDDHETH
jgi:tRNA A-37 threonylcarbamoyl transferase component Bud32